MARKQRIKYFPTTDYTNYTDYILKTEIFTTTDYTD